MTDEQQEKELQTLLRISQFVLNRQTIGFRSEIHEFLVGTVLDESGGHEAMSLDRIVAGIEHVTGLNGYPAQPVSDAIDSMLSKGDLKLVSLLDEFTYVLSPDKIRELRLTGTEYSEIRVTVESELVQYAKPYLGRMSKSVRTKLMKSFDYVLGQVSVAYSIRITAHQEKPKAKLLEHTKVGVLEEFIRSSVEIFFRGEKRKKAEKAINEYLESQSNALASYLHGITSAFYVIQILNLDPECQGVTKEEISNITIYLDTNVIMSALLGPDFLRNAIADLVKLLVDQGARVQFTSETMDEFLFVMNASRKRCEKLSLTQEQFDKIEPLLEDGFAKDFLRRKINQPTLTVAGYFGRLEHIDTVMLRRLGVQLEKDHHDELVMHQDYPLLMRLMSSNDLKAPPTAEHDAIHLLLIQTLREGQPCGLLGPRFWFLTLDFSLAIVETHLDGANRIQSSIHPDQLTQLLTPVLSPDTTSIELPRLYANLFRTRLTEAGRILSEQDLLKIQGPWMDYEDLGTDEIREIVGNEHFQRYIKSTPEQDVTSKDLSDALEPVITEMKQLRIIEDARIKSQGRNYLIKGVMTISLLVIINTIMLVLLVSFLGLAVGATFWGITIGIQLGVSRFFSKEIRKGFGLEQSG